jgi:hypothetical protein
LAVADIIPLLVLVLLVVMLLLLLPLLRDERWVQELWAKSLVGCAGGIVDVS